MLAVVWVKAPVKFWFSIGGEENNGYGQQNCNSLEEQFKEFRLGIENENLKKKNKKIKLPCWISNGWILAKFEIEC